MKKIVTALTLAITTTLAVLANAAEVVKEYQYITKVNVGPDGHLYVSVPGNLSTEHGCQGPWFARSEHPLSNEITKAQLQVAMASFLGRKKVHIWTSGQCTGPGYPVFTKLQVWQE